MTYNHYKPRDTLPSGNELRLRAAAVAAGTLA